MQIFVVACLSTEEGHTPPGSPQGKFLLLKIIKNSKRKYQESFLNSPEILDSREKNLQFGVLLEYSNTNTMQKESIHLDLWFKSYGWSKFLVNI